MRNLFFLILMLLPFAAHTAFAQAPTALEIGKPIERELKVGETQSFQVELRRGKFLNATVEQQGIDVVVRVFAPDGSMLAEIDSPTGDQGSELVAVEAKTDGTHRIEIAPLDKNKTGRYTMTLISAAAAAALPPLRGQLLKQVQKLNLSSSNGKIPAFYSSGYEYRVKEMRPALEKMVEFYKRKLGIKPDFRMAVLAKEDWKKYFANRMPYGLPNANNLDLPYFIFLPATTKDSFVTLGVLKNGEQVYSAEQLKELKANGFDFEQAANKFVDSIAFHETGHILYGTYGIGYKSRWLPEFMATYFAYAFLSEKYPRLAALYRIIHTQAGIHPAAKEELLEDFERGYLGVGEDYGWYQRNFTEKAVEVYNRRGLKFITEVRNAFPNSEKGELNFNETLARMEKIDAGFTQWAKNLK